MAAAPPAWRSPSLPIKIGVSSCLLGEEVRYDGGHQKDSYIARLGRLVAGVKAEPREVRLERYAGGFMQALQVKATTKKHVNVLQHIVGFFKTKLSGGEKRELLGLIGDYARGLVPVIVPITLINHYVARFEAGYVTDQVYLHPHPTELMLRNHI